MYRIGQAEIKQLQRLFDSGAIFRYGSGGECDRFERNWARYVGVGHCLMTRSGTSALYAALVGLGVGPGDQVIVPAYTLHGDRLGGAGSWSHSGNCRCR